MEWPVHEVKSWKEFHDFINHLTSHGRHYIPWIFRGQSNFKWPLHPPLLRIIKETKTSLKKLCGIEFGSYLQFRSHYRLYGDNVLHEESSVLAWWMEMQHFSFPTRLLDWSSSPYVAAYFAVNELPNHDGALWFCWDNLIGSPNFRENFERYGDDHFNENQDLNLYVLMGANYNARSTAQQGMFTVCTNPLGEHDVLMHKAITNYQTNYSGGKTPILYGKVKIPHHLKPEFMMHLNYMNINAKALFPGLDGLGKYSKECIQKRIWGIRQGWES